MDAEVVQRLKGLSRETLLGIRPVYRALMTQRTGRDRPQAECVSAVGALMIGTRASRLTARATRARNTVRQLHVDVASQSRQHPLLRVHG